MLIIASRDKDLQQKVSSLLEQEKLSFRFIEEENDFCTRVRDDDFSILLLDYRFSEGGVLQLCIDLRKDFVNRPIQILIIAEDPENVRDCLELGADDFICRPIRDLEFLARVRAGLIRVKGQREVFSERDFFRNAVRHEEELSNKILDQHLHLREAFSNIERINRELQQSNRKLERIARYDMLSGLLNRMSLFHAIDMEIERSVRNNIPLSGIMIDLDHFKAVNDNYGHLAGDEVLRKLGKILIEQMRRYDQAGRYGGEEFFLILPDTSLEQAMSIAERFRQRIAEVPVKIGEEELTVTASFGIASFRPGESREHWIARADRAMYKAKQSGRNRVEQLS